MNDRHPLDTSPPHDDAGRDPAEDRDSLLTAYALDQLNGDQRARVERLLADDDEARRAVAETRAIAAALRGEPAADATPPSSDLRRAVIAALALHGTDAGMADDAVQQRSAQPGTGTPQQRTGTATVTPPGTGAGAAARRGVGPAWLALSGALAASVLVGLVVTQRPAALRPESGIDGPRPVSPAAPLAKRQAGSDESALRPEREAREKLAVTDGLARAMAAASVPPGQEVAAAAAPAATNGVLAPGGPVAISGARLDAKAATPDRASTPAAEDLAAAAPARRDRLVEAERLALPAAPAPDRRNEQAELQFGRRLAEGVGEPQANARPAPADVAESRRAAATGERYARFEENRFRAAADAPLSTFSIDVDTASYALVRRFLTGGRLPPPDAVRIEELLNAFRYDDPAPAGADPFSVTVEAATCPWRSGHRLVRIGLRGRDVPRAERPAGNLVFLVDVSGSMGDDDKLPLVKQGLMMLVEELTPDDRVAIVTYAGAAGLRLPSTGGADKAAILAAIESLTAGGGTNGSAGIELAYAQAAAHFVRGGVNRVILATDGDLNVGITDDAALADLITRQARGGTFLTVLGVGRGNLQDAKLETLAAHGNGLYAYLDGAREARKVLVEQLTGSLVTIAKDVKIQVEFNPAVVASWRLVGYENRVLAARDFRDDTKDAGDIGAGHAVTALYELALVDEADDQAGGEPLRYRPREAPAAVAPAPPASAELLTVKLRFKQPDGDTSVLREVPLAARGGAFTEASANLRFAASVAAFGMLLRESPFAGDATFAWVATTAAKALGTDAGGWRTEFLDLVRQAAALSAQQGPPGVSPAPVPLPR
jgi:Ca-activated chloride channel family protein